jgi:hypothetical protein
VSKIVSEPLYRRKLFTHFRLTFLEPKALPNNFGFVEKLSEKKLVDEDIVLLRVGHLLFDQSFAAVAQ